MESSITMHQNEKRAFKLSLYNNNLKHSLDASYHSVYDSDGGVVISEQGTYKHDNYSTLIIGTVVTQNIGEYSVLWKLVDTNDYVFYHKINLRVI